MCQGLVPLFQNDIKNDIGPWPRGQDEQDLAAYFLAGLAVFFGCLGALGLACDSNPLTVFEAIL